MLSSLICWGILLLLTVSLCIHAASIVRLIWRDPYPIRYRVSDTLLVMFGTATVSAALWLAVIWLFMLPP